MGRPGIMLYFDILEPIRMLPDEDKGKLLVAMLEYGRDGIKPELDGMLGIVWSFVQPKIDKDGERYEDSKLQREYAVFCKKRKRIWMPKILFEDWIVMTDDERKRAVDPVLARNPSSTNNVHPSEDSVHPSSFSHHPSENNIQSQSSYNNPHYATDTLHLGGGEDEGNQGDPTADNNNLKVMNGQLGQGVVFLTDEQTADLLEKLDLEVFNKYVRKLANYIIRNGHDVADHYGTILKWWRQDCGLTPR